MDTPDSSDARADRPTPRVRVRLPGFVNLDHDVGLGDAIKLATSMVGIKPCGGCAQRADTLNRALMFGQSAPRDHSR